MFLMALAVILAIVVVVAVSAGTKPAEAAFPGNNGKIAFTSDRDGNPEIYTMNPDGSNQLNLTNKLVEDYGPSWSPSGNRIAFTSYPVGDSGEIYTMNSDGTGIKRLTNNAVGDFYPSWSPDGKKIAFSGSSITNPTGTGYEIYTISVGGGRTRVTNNDTGDSHPSWGRRP